MLKYRNRLLLIFILVFLVFQPIDIVGENVEGLVSETLAVVLVIDTSGSMSNTDPERLRESASNIFIDLLSTEDYLSIITFNSDVDLKIPLKQIKNQQTKEEIKEILSKNLDTNGNTDYLKALDMANEELINIKEKNLRKVIVFLTDGEPEPDNIDVNNKEMMDNYLSLLWDKVKEISNNRFPVYSLGLSKMVNPEILNRISTDTKGDFKTLNDPTELAFNFYQILSKLNDSPINTVLPSLTIDFWLKNEGYRLGEEIVINSSLVLGGNRLISGEDLVIDNFNYITEYEDETQIVIGLYDNGNSINGDVKNNDGIWSNKILLDKDGQANVSLIASGLYKEEYFKLEKPIGALIVYNPGNIIVTPSTDKIWAKAGEKILLSMTLENNSFFKERVWVNLEDEIGTPSLRQIDLEPNSKLDLDIFYKLNKNIDIKTHKIGLNLMPVNEFTSIDLKTDYYNVEILSSLDYLKKMLENKIIGIILIFTLFFIVPLFIYLIGLLLYLILVKPNAKVNGILTYWSEGEDQASANKNQIILNNKKSFIISFDESIKGDYNIADSKYKYYLEIIAMKNKEEMKYVMGWKTLFTKNIYYYLFMKCSQPGIIIFNENIVTEKILVDRDVFSTGGFVFQFEKSKSKWGKTDVEGKDVLEGRA